MSPAWVGGFLTLTTREVHQGSPLCSVDDYMRLTQAAGVWVILPHLPQKVIHGGTSPGGPVVKNLPSNAGDAALIPGWGNKLPRAPGQLNPGISTIEKPKLCK